MTKIKVTLKDKGVSHFFRAGHKFIAGEERELEVNEGQLKQLVSEPKLNVVVVEEQSKKTTSRKPAEKKAEAK